MIYTSRYPECGDHCHKHQPGPHCIELVLTCIINSETVYWTAEALPVYADIQTLANFLTKLDGSAAPISTLQAGERSELTSSSTLTNMRGSEL